MPELPDSLDLDAAYRSAFYMVLQYAGRCGEPDEDLVLLLQYLWSDPARWHDWQSAVIRALEDGGSANPDHEGRWRERSEMPEF